MNIRNTEPNIPNAWRGNVTDCCVVLGRDGHPVDRHTFNAWVRRYNVPCKWNSHRNARVFEGKDIKKLWNILT